MKRFIFFSIISSIILFTIACDKNFVPVADQLLLPETPYDYATFDNPADITFNDCGSLIGTPILNPDGDIIAVDNTISNCDIDNNIATLGRVLFYDKKLSLNNSISCASCHHQVNAFADPVALSEGFENKKTTRNSLAITNVRFNGGFFWDNQPLLLQEQVLMPVKNHIEMGIEKMDDLEYKLSKVDYYPELYKAAYGDTDIKSENLADALSQFLQSMITLNSKYDEGVASFTEISQISAILPQDFPNFTKKENIGKRIFFDNGCDGCHSVPNFSPHWGHLANIGLDKDYEDEGAGNGNFKVPSLRNVGLTAPYMHDGRFETLMDVINHYNDGIKPHRSLDWRLQDHSSSTSTNDLIFFPTNNLPENFTPTPKKMKLTEYEKEALVAFLHTLTDNSFTQDIRFSDPFVR